MSVGDAGMKQSMLLMTVVLNADHGPWSEERWLQEAREGGVAYLRIADATCPLYQSQFHNHAEDLGAEDRLGEEGWRTSCLDGSQNPPLGKPKELR